VIDVPTLQSWLEKLGFTVTSDAPGTLRLRQREGTGGEGSRGAPPLPPFYAQCSEHWVLLSLLPMLDPDEYIPDGLHRLLLAMNREMRVVKFALDRRGAVVLCAELPTESLDFSELADAIEQLLTSARRFQAELAGP